MLIGHEGKKTHELIKEFNLSFREARVETQIMKLIYSDVDERRRVCYVLGTDHPDSDVAKRIRFLDTGKIFEIHKIRNLLKLPTTLEGREQREFDEWE